MVFLGRPKWIYIRMRFAFFFSGTSCWALFGFGTRVVLGGEFGVQVWESGRMVETFALKDGDRILRLFLIIMFVVYRIVRLSLAMAFRKGYVFCFQLSRGRVLQKWSDTCSRVNISCLL